MIMRIEIIHMRDPDSPCELVLFFDGQRETGVNRDHRTVDTMLPDVALRLSGALPLTVDVYDIDPGAGYSLDDWNESTEHDCADATPAAAACLRQLRDEIARTSDYIERPVPA